MCLGLSQAAQAHDETSAAYEMNRGQSERTGGHAIHTTLVERLTGVYAIQGEVLRVEDENYFVKGQDGKEARLFVNHNTRKVGTINPGDRIGAKVKLLNHALAIFPAQVTDVVSRE